MNKLALQPPAGHSNPMDRSTTRAIQLALLAFSCFSLSDTLAKLLGEELSPMQIVGTGAWFIVAYGLVLLKYTTGTIVPTTTTLKSHLARAGLMTGAVLINFWALPFIPLSQFYTLMFTSPFFTALLAYLFFKESLDLRLVLAIILGFSGVVIAVGPHFDSLNLLLVLLLLSAAAFSGSSLVTRYISFDESLLNLALYPKLLAAIALSPWVFEVFSSDIATRDLLLIFVQSIFDLTAYLCIGRAFQLGAASIVAPFHYVQLLWGVGMGFLLWNDVPHTNELIGAALVTLCGIMILRRKDKANDAPVVTDVAASS